MNTRYARGSKAWGECARSGIRMYLLDMVEDPRTGLLVAPDWIEQPEPRPPQDIYDGVALERPAPDLDQIGTVVFPGTVADLVTGEPLRPLVSKYFLGLVKGVSA